MQKVYVVTKAELMEAAEYVTVKATKKEAGQVIRAVYPNARKETIYPGFDSFTCKGRDGHESLMFIKEKSNLIRYIANCLKRGGLSLRQVLFFFCSRGLQTL